MNTLRRNALRHNALVLLSLCATFAATPLRAQVPPTATEVAAHQGLHAAAHRGGLQAIQRLSGNLSANLSANKAALQARDGAGRTPLHVATFARQSRAVQALLQAGAWPGLHRDGTAAAGCRRALSECTPARQHRAHEQSHAHGLQGTRG